jgi:DNA gyrase subunit B
MPARTACSKDADPNFSGDDTREGLTAIVSVKHPDPQFESQTKVKLMNPEVQTYVTQVVGEAFGTFLEENPQAAKAIILNVSPLLGRVMRRVRRVISSSASLRLSR